MSTTTIFVVTVSRIDGEGNKLNSYIISLFFLNTFGYKLSIICIKYIFKLKLGLYVYSKSTTTIFTVKVQRLWESMGKQIKVNIYYFFLEFHKIFKYFKKYTFS